MVVGWSFDLVVLSAHDDTGYSGLTSKRDLLREVSFCLLSFPRNM